MTERTLASEQVGEQLYLLENRATKWAYDAKNALTSLSQFVSGLDSGYDPFAFSLDLPANYETFTMPQFAPLVLEKSYTPPGLPQINSGKIAPPRIEDGPNWDVAYHGPRSIELDSINDISPLTEANEPTIGDSSYVEPSTPKPTVLKAPNPYNKPSTPLVGDIAYTQPSQPQSYTPGAIPSYIAPNDISADLTVGSVDRPQLPTINSVPGPQLGTEPTWDSGDEPNFDFSGEPGALVTTPIGATPTIDDVTIADFGGYEEPVLPKLQDVVIPSVDDLVLDEIHVDIPPPPDGLNGTPASFNYSEGNYVGDLAHLQDEVHRIIGADNKIERAVPAAIWDALWLRATNNIIRQGVAHIREARRAWAKLGWSMPGGLALSRVEQAQQEINEQVSAKALEIAIQDATQKRDDFWQAITQGIALEKMAEDFFNTVQERALKAAIAEVEASVSIVNALIAKYNADIANTQAAIELAKLKLQSAMSKLEVGRLKLDSAKARGELNQQNVQLYVAMWEGIKNAIDVWKSTIEGARLKLDVQRTRLEAHGESIKLRGLEVDAWAKQWAGYSSKMEGQQIKGTVYETKARVFGERMKAFSIKSDVEKTRVEAAVQTEQLKIEAAKQDVERYKALITAVQSELEAKTRVYEVDSKVYLGKIDGEKTRIETAISKERLMLDSANQQVEHYKAMWAGIQSKLTSASQIYTAAVQAYQSDVQAETARVSSDIQVQELQLKNSELDVAVFKAAWDGIQAKLQSISQILAAEVQLYDAKLKHAQAKQSGDIEIERLVQANNQGKVQAFAATVQAYTAELQGKAQAIDAMARAWQAKAGVEGTRVQAEIAIEQEKLAVYNAEVEGFKAAWQAISADLQAQAQIATAQSQAYTAYGSVESSRMEANGRVLDVAIKRAALTLESTTKAAELSVQKFIGVIGLQEKGLEALGAAYSQLLSAVYAASNIGASISSSESTQYAASESMSRSYSVNGSLNMSGTVVGGSDPIDWTPPVIEIEKPK